VSHFLSLALSHHTFRAIPKHVQQKYFHIVDFKLSDFEKMHTRAMKRVPGGGMALEVRSSAFKNSTLPNKRDFLELTHCDADARMSLPYDPAQRTETRVASPAKKSKSVHQMRAYSEKKPSPVPASIPAKPIANEFLASPGRLAELFEEVVRGHHVIRKLSRGVTLRHVRGAKTRD